jgi:Domain of unknown function (DUF3471)
MKQKYTLIIITLLISLTAIGQAPESQRLSVDFYRTAEYDSLRVEIIETMNRYYKAKQLWNRANIDSLTHNDYQYLHDLNGDYVPKALQGESFFLPPDRKSLYGRGNRPIPGTIKVFPINRYMALLTMRTVYTNVRYTDGAVFDLGIVDQILEFKELEDGRWQVSRHYSVDHHPDYNGNQADRKVIEVDKEILKEYVGRYKVSYDLYLTVNLTDDGLKLNLNTTDNEITEGPFDLFPASKTVYFRKNKWVDWVYEFKKVDDGVMSLTVHLNNQLFGYGEQIKQ